MRSRTLACGTESEGAGNNRDWTPRAPLLPPRDPAGGELRREQDPGRGRGLGVVGL